MGVLCGIDIIEIDRIKRSFEVNGDEFRDRIFTLNEIEYCENKKASKYLSYAARFAAKEAVSKALGTGIARGVGWKQIEILKDEQDKPCVVLSGKAQELYFGLNAIDIAISLSHCRNYAVASVVIQTK